MSNRPGTKIKKYFESKGIKTTAGCNCNSIANRMDRLGPEGCLKHLEALATAMRASAKTWKEKKGGVWRAFPIPPRVYFINLIKWASNG